MNKVRESFGQMNGRRQDDETEWAPTPRYPYILCTDGTSYLISTVAFIYF